MIEACTRQFRAGAMGPIGLDFGTILAMGDALGADRRMLAEVLPAVEGSALAMLNDDQDDGEGED